MCQCEFGAGEGIFKAVLKILYAVFAEVLSPFSDVGKTKLTGESGRKGLFSMLLLSGERYPFL